MLSTYSQNWTLFYNTMMLHFLFALYKLKGVKLVYLTTLLVLYTGLVSEYYCLALQILCLAVFENWKIFTFCDTLVGSQVLFIYTHFALLRPCVNPMLSCEYSQVMFLPWVMTLAAAIGLHIHPVATFIMPFGVLAYYFIHLPVIDISFDIILHPAC
jgi:hypothetical protein